IDREVYTEWPIDMEVRGTFHNVGMFLDKIRQLPRIVNITTLRLNVRAAEGDAAATQSVGATYVATTFVYKEEGIASTAPPPTPVKRCVVAYTFLFLFLPSARRVFLNLS